jgi:hypothetical protein
VALEVISGIRKPIYPYHQLLVRKAERTRNGNRGADAEYKRRYFVRKINEELSRYYPLPEKEKKPWTAGRLMSEGRHESDRS